MRHVDFNDLRAGAAIAVDGGVDRPLDGQVSSGVKIGVTPILSPPTGSLSLSK